MKEPKAKRFGIRSTAQAYCKLCGWQGANWSGKDSWANAAAELKSHKTKEAHSAILSALE